jgi:hypothetical protein
MERARLRGLWAACEFKIRRHDGWVTTQPHAFPLRFECLPTNQLPELLEDMGFVVRNAGVAERLLPVIREVKQAGGVTKIVSQALAPTEICIYQCESP